MPRNSVYRGHILLLILNKDVTLHTIFFLPSLAFGTDRTSYVQRKCVLTALVETIY